MSEIQVKIHNDEKATVEMELTKDQESEVEDLTVNKDGGVLKTILWPGVEPNVYPRKGDAIFVHYFGMLKENGKKFDDSWARDQVFCFSLGRGQVIKGWDLCVATMCRGERARLECRSDYAYGASGSPPKIPANATLVFEIELLRFEGEDLSPDRDGTILKSILRDAKNKFDSPPEFSKVRVTITGKDATGREFFPKQDLEFFLGECSEHGLPPGVDKAIHRMNRGEKALVTLSGRFGYGLEPTPELGLEKMAEVNFTIFLKGYEKKKANWELNDEEKLERAQNFKDCGTEFFNAGKYSVALNKYSAIIALMEHARPTKPDDEGGIELTEKFEQMFFAGLLNSALACLRLGDTIEAIKFCDRVLEKKPNNVKALYRKAQAYQQRKDFDEAISIFRKVLEIDPESKASAQQILDCKQQKVSVKERQRKTFKGMFDSGTVPPHQGKFLNGRGENNGNEEEEREEEEENGDE